MRLNAPRVAPVPVDEWTDEQRTVLGPALERTGARNMFGVVVQNWDAYRVREPFVRYILGPTFTLDPRHRELVVLRVGWLGQAEYVFAQHRRIGESVGLTEAEIERVKAGADAPGWTPIEAAVLRATDELLGDTMIGDDTWKALTAEYSTAQVLDLVYAVSSYLGVAMLANTLGIALEGGDTGF
jgi:alkylhydroperoxidase family enzyme